MTSSSLPAQNLVLNIVDEHFGPIVKAVTQVLLRVHRITLADVTRRVKKDIDDGPRRKGPGLPVITQKHVKDSLLVLLQHNCLDVMMPTEEELGVMPENGNVRLYYRLRVNEVLERLRFARFSLHIKKKFDELSCIIIEMLQLHGRLVMGDAIKTVVEHMVYTESNLLDAKADYSDNGKGGFSYEHTMLRKEIAKAFRELVSGRYIVQAKPLDLSKPSPAPDGGDGTKKGMNFNDAKKQKTANGKSTGKSAGKSAAGSDTSGTQQVRKKRQRPAAVDPDMDSMPVEMQLLFERSDQMNDSFASAAGSSSAFGDIPNALEEEVEWSEDPSANGTHASNDMQPPAAKRPRGGGMARGRGVGVGRGRGRGQKVGFKEALQRAAAAQGETGAGQNGSLKRSFEDGPANAFASKSGFDEWGMTKGAVWRLGHDQFHRDFRHACCIRLVQDKLKHHIAVAIMETFLEISAPTEKTEADVCSEPIAVQDLLRKLQTRTFIGGDMSLVVPGAKLQPTKLSWDHLKRWLQLLCADSSEMLSRISGAGFDDKASAFTVNMGNMINYVRKKALHANLAEKYDTQCARICQVLQQNKYLEQQTVSELAMLPQKETREKLYHLYRDRIVSLQEVSKRGDHNPATTIYLWSVQPTRVDATMLAMIQKSLLNIRLRRQALYTRDRYIIERAKVNSEDEMKKYKQTMNMLKMLDLAQIRLDNTIMLYKTF